MFKIVLVLALFGLAHANVLPMARRTFGQRIVGGAPANKGDYKFMVDVRRGGHYCGGAIVNQDWVLTAAHCSGGAPSAYTLVAGDHNIQNEDGDEQSRSVSQVVIHPNYNSGTIDNDAALMRVSAPFDLNSPWVEATVLAMGTEATFDGDADVIGWGSLSEGGGSPTILQQVKVPIVQNPACNAAYNQAGYEITPSMICAGVMGEGGKDACQGDSGGPMMCERGGHGSGVWVHCGIVSWGIGCARPNYPGVYGRTSYFEDFIAATIGA